MFPRPPAATPGAVFSCRASLKKGGAVTPASANRGSVAPPGAFVLGLSFQKAPREREPSASVATTRPALTVPFFPSYGGASGCIPPLTKKLRRKIPPQGNGARPAAFGGRPVWSRLYFTCSTARPSHSPPLHKPRACGAPAARGIARRAPAPGAPAVAQAACIRRCALHSWCLACGHSRSASAWRVRPAVWLVRLWCPRCRAFVHHVLVRG